MGNAGMAVAKLIIFFYCTELVLNNIWRQWDIMRLTTCVTLAVLGSGRRVDIVVIPAKAGIQCRVTQATGSRVSR